MHDLEFARLALALALALLLPIIAILRPSLRLLELAILVVQHGQKLLVALGRQSRHRPERWTEEEEVEEEGKGKGKGRPYFISD